jgi:hypothetical protein
MMVNIGTTEVDNSHARFDFRMPTATIRKKQCITRTIGQEFNF